MTVQEMFTYGPCSNQCPRPRDHKQQATPFFVENLIVSNWRIFQSCFLWEGKDVEKQSK